MVRMQAQTVRARRHRSQRDEAVKQRQRLQRRWETPLQPGAFSVNADTTATINGAALLPQYEAIDHAAKTCALELISRIASLA